LESLNHQVHSKDIKIHYQLPLFITDHQFSENEHNESIWFK